MSDGISSAYREQREAEERERTRLANLRLVAAALGLVAPLPGDADAPHLAVAALGFWEGEPPEAVVESLLAKDRAAWARLLVAVRGSPLGSRFRDASPFAGKTILVLKWHAYEVRWVDRKPRCSCWTGDGHDPASTAYLRALAAKDGNDFEFTVGDGLNTEYRKFLVLALPPV